MATPYIGEIKMFAGNFAPNGWLFCEGQLLAISENDTLFNLIGTTYGGDGQTTFALPDLRGRLPLHQGTGTHGINHVLGETGGVEQVTLTPSQLPQHTHTLHASAAPATRLAARDGVLAQATGATVSPYGSDNPLGSLSPQSLSTAGNNQPHENMQPFLCVSFIISLYGIYPAP